MDPIAVCSSDVVVVDLIFFTIDPVGKEHQHIGLGFNEMVGQLVLPRCKIFGVDIHANA